MPSLVAHDKNAFIEFSVTLFFVYVKKHVCKILTARLIVIVVMVQCNQLIASESKTFGYGISQELNVGVIDSMVLKMKGSVCYETVVLRRWRG